MNLPTSTYPSATPSTGLPSASPHGAMFRPAAAAALVLCAGAALAQSPEVGGGDFSAAPMYRALNEAFISYGDTVVGGGLNYVSNVSPSVNAFRSGRLDLDGATAFYTASAQYSGFFASRNYASLTVSNAQDHHNYYVVAGQGTTTTIEFGNPTAAAQRAVFRWNVTGGNSVPDNIGVADAKIDFYGTPEEGRGSWLNLFNGGFGLQFGGNQQLTAFGEGNYVYTLPDAPIGTPIFLYFWSSAFVQVPAGAVPTGSSFTITANYASTYVLEGIALYDANDELITDWVMTDTLTNTPLFDASGRLVPVDPSAPIPEPGTWALLLAGLVGLGWRRRQGQR